MGGDNDEEMVRLAFRTLDKDGSGTIDTGEFKHLMTHIGDKLTEEEVMVRDVFHDYCQVDFPFFRGRKTSGRAHGEPRAKDTLPTVNTS